MKVVVGVLALSLIAVVCAEGQTRLDDELLLIVAKRELKQAPGIRCVRGPNLYKADDRVSDWLFERLRRSRRSLTPCAGAPTFDAESELVLGPVRWDSSQTEATVYFGYPIAILGQRAFLARRDARGRWRFIQMTME